MNERWLQTLKYIFLKSDYRTKMVLKWHPVFIPDVQQKLVFLGQEGYDIFGKNDMFAPRVKWQSLEQSVEEIKTQQKAMKTLSTILFLL